MAQRIITFGQPYGLHIQIDCARSSSGRSAEEATKGKLLLWIGEDLIWGKSLAFRTDEPIEWSWVELLEFLSNAWPYLEFEFGYPFGLNPIWPAWLRSEAEVRWQSMPDELVREEEEELLAYEETHDLSRGVHGLLLPSVWIVREGDLMTIGSDRKTLRRPLIETLETLTQFGDFLASKLTALSDARSRAAIRGWGGRRNVELRRFTQISTRWADDDLKSLVGDQGIEETFELSERHLRMTEPLEIVGLARGHLGIDELRILITLVKSSERRETSQIDTLSSLAAELLEKTQKERPYSQGYALAHWTRQQRGFVDDRGRVEMEEIFNLCGIGVEEISLESELVDAVACWGPKHGPVVWLNTSSKRTTATGGRRATLAHEFCHLLADRTGALPLADVVNGNVAKWVEQRAEAFAAELLLPRQIARQASESIEDTDNLIDHLTRRYGVSQELAAWQIRNSGASLTPSRSSVLRSLVSDPGRF